ncbi:MAG: inorganic phosphate transporter [Ignavibacteria bacterium]|nr:inorganic phosphate transporter [Ignavibacteria bacterium]
MLVLIFGAVLILAYANGANDNFKGVATLWGSGTLGYRSALALTTVATFAGSIFSFYFASVLVKNFSGKGLVPDVIIHSPEFILAIALAAGITVLIATFFGFPISTTHGLVGALFGAGVVAAPSLVNNSKLGLVFVLPLLISPFVSMLFSSTLYRFFHASRVRAGVTEESCVCVGKQWVPASQFATYSSDGGVAANVAYAARALGASYTPVAISTASESYAASSAGTGNVPRISNAFGTDEGLRIVGSVDSQDVCAIQYQGNFLGVNFQPLLNYLHYGSAATVSFARGLNDTPKLVSLLLITQLLDIPIYISVIAAAIAVGGLLNSRKVADTMSNKISHFNNGQGFTANFVTGLLVISATLFGMPVSTTHVSVGSIFGIGMVNKTANTSEIAKIVSSWVLTLPIAAVISGLLYFAFHSYNG